MSVFDEHMPGNNQITRPTQSHLPITAANLVEVPTGRLSEEGFRRNIDVGLRYIESWLRGNGCVPIYNLMEDAATAEICRAQLWQWIRYGAKLDDGRAITSDLHDETLRQIVADIRNSLGDEAYSLSKFNRASELMRILSRGEFEEFLTTAAYTELN